MLFPVQISKVHEMLMTDLLEGIPLIHREVYKVNEEVLLYLTQQKSTEDSRIIIHYSDSPLSYHCLLRVTDFFCLGLGHCCLLPVTHLLLLWLYWLLVIFYFFNINPRWARVLQATTLLTFGQIRGFTIV